MRLFLLASMAHPFYNFGSVALPFGFLLVLALAFMPTQRTAVYTGSFDPITLGHLHIIDRATKLFDTLVIGIGINADKRPLFDTSERVALVEAVTGSLGNVIVDVFSGLAVDFVRKMDAHIMVRGIRPLTDTAGEFTMMMANHQLDPGIETVFLMADEQYTHVSSSLLKQIASVSDDDAQLAKFVPSQVIPALRARMKGR